MSTGREAIARDEEIDRVAKGQINRIERVLKKQAPQSDHAARKILAEMLWEANGYANWDQDETRHLVGKSIWDQWKGVGHATEELAEVTQLAKRLQTKIIELPVEAIDVMLAEAGADVGRVGRRSLNLTVRLWPHEATTAEVPNEDKRADEVVHLTPPSRIPAAREVPHLFDLTFVLLPRFIEAASSAHKKLSQQRSSASHADREIKKRNAAKPQKELIAKVAAYAFTKLTGKKATRTSSKKRSPFVAFLHAIYADAFGYVDDEGITGAEYMAKKVLASMKTEREGRVGETKAKQR